jgi:hypothetical protein
VDKGFWLSRRSGELDDGIEAATDDKVASNGAADEVDENGVEDWTRGEESCEMDDWGGGWLETEEYTGTGTCCALQEVRKAGWFNQWDCEFWVVAERPSISDIAIGNDSRDEDDGKTGNVDSLDTCARNS